MTPGDLVIVAGLQEFGKPRPGLVLQSYSVEGFPTFTYVPLTSILYNLPGVRIRVLPDVENGLRQLSEIMVDRIQTVGMKRMGQKIGRLDEETMGQVRLALLVFLGLV